MNLPHFGEIDLEHLEETYEVIIKVENQKDFPLELWFDSEKLSISEMQPILGILTNLSEMKIKSKQYLFNDGRSTLDEYLNHHLNELSESDKSKFGIFEEDDKQTILKKLEDNIHLKSISIWAESDDILKFDYTIGYLITDYVICLNANKELEISNICIES